jgi:hypothetical protein
VAGFKHPVHHSLGIAVVPLWDGCEKKYQSRTDEKCSDGEAIPRGAEGLAVVDMDRSGTWHFEKIF